MKSAPKIIVFPFLAIALPLLVVSESASVRVVPGGELSSKGMQVESRKYSSIETQVSKKLGNKGVADFSGLLTLLLVSSDGKLQSWGHVNLSMDGSCGIVENGYFVFFYLPSQEGCNRLWITKLDPTSSRPETTFHYRDVKFQQFLSLDSKRVKIAHVGGTKNEDFYLIRWPIPDSEGM